MTVDYIGLLGVVIEGLKELHKRCTDCDMEVQKQIEELEEWERKIIEANYKSTTGREKLEEEQKQLYEKYENLLNETKLLEEEVYTLIDDLFAEDLDELEKLFDLDYFIDIGEDEGTSSTGDADMMTQQTQ